MQQCSEGVHGNLGGVTKNKIKMSIEIVCEQ
jgi:hypothetical protein